MIILETIPKRLNPVYRTPNRISTRKGKLHWNTQPGSTGFVKIADEFLHKIPGTARRCGTVCQSKNDTVGAIIDRPSRSDDLCTQLEGPAIDHRCHCEGRRPVAIRSLSAPQRGRAVQCAAGDADCHVGLRPPRNDVETWWPVPLILGSGHQGIFPPLCGGPHISQPLVPKSQWLTASPRGEAFVPYPACYRNTQQGRSSNQKAFPSRVVLRAANPKSNDCRGQSHLDSEAVMDSALRNRVRD